MQSSFRTNSKLEGVLLADTLILPEKVELTGDLVVIANALVFEGNMPVIEGYGKNVYMAYRKIGKIEEYLPEIEL